MRMLRTPLSTPTSEVSPYAVLVQRQSLYDEAKHEVARLRQENFNTSDKAVALCQVQSGSDTFPT